jgi:hypothetical protein
MVLMLSHSEEQERYEDLVSRGLMKAPPSPRLKRVKRFFFTPFRLLGSVMSKLKWALWGKRQYEKKVRLQADRMRFLATYQSNRDDDVYYTRTAPAPKVDTLPQPIAQAIHDDIIKTKIVREELPKPDYDDGTN